MNSANLLSIFITILGAVACVPIGQTNTSANTPSDQKIQSKELDPIDANNLGVRYSTGRGVAVDQVQAASLFKKACALGNPDGCSNLGSCYARGTGVPQDLSKAAVMFQQACDSIAQGAAACNNLGVLYRDGRGVQEDQVRAAILFKKACEANFAPACNNFGLALDSGQGTVQNRDLALIHLNKACAGGDSDGCRNSRTLGKVLEPIHYVTEPGAPSSQNGSSTRGNGLNSEADPDSRFGKRLTITGRVLPVPVPSGRVDVGFLSNGRVEFGRDSILKIDNGEPVVVSIYGDASVSADGSFTLVLEKGKLGEHKFWALVWFNPRNGEHGDLQGSDGTRYEFEVTDRINEINLGPVKFRQ